MLINSVRKEAHCFWSQLVNFSFQLKSNIFVHYYQSFLFTVGAFSLWWGQLLKFNFTFVSHPKVYLVRSWTFVVNLQLNLLTLSLVFQIFYWPIKTNTTTTRLISFICLVKLHQIQCQTLKSNMNKIFTQIRKTD